jgi:pimeloyl-ACP methyl ester carboxylesterase
MPHTLWFWLGAVILLLALVALAAAFYCYKRIFFCRKRKPLAENEFELPDGEIYEVYRDEIINWVKMTRNMPYEYIETRSDDGLLLRGRYYECQKGAPVELLFHGYRGDAERDLSGGVERCFALNRNVILIDQRGCGRSEGKVTTFGVKERKDCLRWVETAIQRFGDDVTLILGGVSMGAATVMMAASEPLPKNVVCVMADCGYSSQKEIIQKVVKEMKLPVWLVYPFIKLGARLFGRFRLEETTPIECVQKARVPVIFLHGDADDFVPCDMSRRLYEACTSEKALAIIPNAGHGLAFPVEKETYLKAIKDLRKRGKPNKRITLENRRGNSFVSAAVWLCAKYAIRFYTSS